MKPDRFDRNVTRGVLGVGCAALICWAAFWIAVGVIAIHFISKWW